MSQSWSDAAASVLFTMFGYEVLEVARDAAGARTVVITAPAVQATCPGCGVESFRVRQRTRQRLGDVHFDGHIEVVWVMKRWRCLESCRRATFTEHIAQVPPRARLTRFRRSGRGGPAELDTEHYRQNTTPAPAEAALQSLH